MFWLKRSAMLLNSYGLELAKQHYPVSLVTDRKGAKIADFFGWEYQAVSKDLETWDNAGRLHIWSLGKMQAMATQSEPCIQIDGDVLLYKKFPEWFESAGIVAQSLDYKHIYESQVMREIRKVCGFPDDWAAFNTGVMGGTDWKEVLEWCKIAMTASKKLIGNFTNEGGACSLTMEQVSIGKFHPTSLFKSPGDAYESNKIGFRHYVTGRRTPEAMKSLEREFAIMFPEKYQHFRSQWERLADGEGQHVLKSHRLLS